MLVRPPHRAPQDTIVGPIGPPARRGAATASPDEVTPSVRADRPTAVSGVSAARLTPAS